MFSIEDIIDLAIQIEQNGEQVYRNAMKNTPDPALASMLEWVADEEVRHVNWFNEFRKRVPARKVDPRLEELGREILRDALGNQVFSLAEVDFTRISRVQELLDVAIEFEQDTVVFYEMLIPFVEDPQTLASLQDIIEEERRHIEVLRNFRGRSETEPDVRKLIEKSDTRE